MTSHFQFSDFLMLRQCFYAVFNDSWNIFSEFNWRTLHNWTWCDEIFIFRRSFSHFSSHNIKIFFPQKKIQTNYQNTSEQFELRHETEHKKISNKKFEVSANRERIGKNWEIFCLFRRMTSRIAVGQFNMRIFPKIVWIFLNF